MSFGFSVGDIVLLTQITRKTLRNCREAGDDYIEIANAVRCLYGVLRRLRAEVQRPESKIFKQEPAFEDQLLKIVKDCENVLDSLGHILVNYEGLKDKSQAGAGKKLWQRFRFGSKSEELAVIRSNLITYTSSVLIMLQTLHLQATDRVETKIDGGFAGLGGQLEKMCKEVTKIATQSRSEQRNHSTMSISSLSTYTGDEKIVWRDFRRELVKKGFKSKSLEKNKDVLMAYIIKLDQSELLDRNDAPLDVDNVNSSLANKMVTETMNSLADLQLTGNLPSSDGLPQAITEKLHVKPSVDEDDVAETTDTHGKDGSDQKSASPSTQPSISIPLKPPPKSAPRPNSSFSTRSAQSTPDVTPPRAPPPLPGFNKSAHPVPAFCTALAPRQILSPPPHSSAPIRPAPPPPSLSALPPLTRPHTIPPNRSFLDSSCYTLSNGGGSFSHSVTGPALAASVSDVGLSKGAMMKIEDSRWHFQDESRLPKPRKFVGGPKRYRVGRNVPLELSLFSLSEVGDVFENQMTSR